MIHSIQHAKNTNAANGYHFFEPASIRFFGSRLPRTVSPVPNGALFVTSEQRPQGSDESTPNARLYTVRFIHDNGTVHTLGAFQGYQTNGYAKKLAVRLAAEWTAETYLATYTNANGGSFPVAVLGEHTNGDDKPNGVVRLMDVQTAHVFDGGTVNLSEVSRWES